MYDTKNPKNRYSKKQLFKNKLKSALEGLCIMNSNEFLKQNWGGALVVVAVLVFIYLMFGPNRAETGQSNQSFLTDAGTNLAGVPDGSNYGSGGTAPSIQQPAQTGSGEPIQWCVLLDGANHIPDLFGEGIDNGGGGTNWHSNANDDPRGPHGVYSVNGKMVFFVKKSYLDQNNSTPLSAQLKTSAAGWRELTMSWDNIAGEQALVYVK